MSYLYIEKDQNQKTKQQNQTKHKQSNKTKPTLNSGKVQ